MKFEDRCSKTLPSSFVITDHCSPRTSSTFAAEEKNASLSFVVLAKTNSIDAMLNGGTCQACQ